MTAFRSFAAAATLAAAVSLGACSQGDDSGATATATGNAEAGHRTLADSMVTFSADGDVLTATGADGAKAKIAGAALVASNGVVLPLDGLVKSATPAKAS